jgi:aminoglycoside phosphotransferase (APT) family kinase protein
MPDTFLQQLQASYKTTRQDLAFIIYTVMNDEVAEVLPVTQGYSNEVHSIKTKKGQEVIVRIQQRRFMDFEQEAWAMSHARSLGVNVPEVYDVRRFDIAGKTHDVMMMQKIKGKPLGEVPTLEPSQMQYICKQLGELLEKLRSSPVSGFGFPKENQTWEFDTWQSYVASSLQKREGDAPYLVQAGLSEQEVSHLLEIASEMKAQENQKPVLCHADIGFEHVFVNDDLELVALIDWGMCQGNSYALDVAVFLMYNPDIELSWIIKDYSSLGVSEIAFRREVIMQQVNVGMSFLGHNLREGNEDYREVALQSLRSMIENWQLLT